MAYLQNLRERNPNKTDLEIPYDYSYDIDHKSRKDWSGTQSQLWTSPQRDPQKTKFPYGLSRIQKSRWISEDTSGGQWYFEDELIFATPANKWNNNIYMDGWTGGKILMTKQQAYEMGLTPQQIINLYNEDKLFYDSAKKTNTKPSLFFEYRKDGSISGKWKPPIIPPPAPVAPPPGVLYCSWETNGIKL